jgi:ABC-type glycerol-3-phosphate transport system permease component
MSKERRILSWGALAASLLVCCPCAALSGFVAFIGAYSMLDGASSVATRSDLFNLVAFSTVSAVAVVIGLALLYWSVRSLLTTEDVATGASPVPRDGGQEQNVP